MVEEGLAVIPPFAKGRLGGILIFPLDREPPACAYTHADRWGFQLPPFEKRQDMGHSTMRLMTGRLVE